MVDKQGGQAAGEKRGRKPWTLREFGGKTLWDWLQLLLVPLLLGIVAAGLTAWFNEQQNVRQQEIEDQRAKVERELAERRAQNEALQAYLDQMSTLLLEKKLRDSEQDSEVRTLARARTLTVLGRLAPSYKRQVMQFLLEAGLVTSVDEGDPVVIDLALTNLRGVDLRRKNLSGVQLVMADLSGAHLSFADLSKALVSEADLSHANLSHANLRGTALNRVDLSHANLSHADLGNLAFLIDADLSYADLSGASLDKAVLKGANLSHADLSEAELSYADMSDVKGMSNAQLEQQAASLEGATMPNGQQYEEWLQDKQDRTQ